MSSLRDLLNARISKDSRATFRYAFCLDPELRDEWAEAADELDDLPELRPEGPKERANGPRVQLRNRVAELERRVAEASVVGVFKARTPDEMEAIIAAWDATKVPTPQRARELVLACLDHFEQGGIPVPAENFNADDLAQLLPRLSQGELYGVSTPLSNLTNSVLDLPKSVTQLAQTRTSETNSKHA
jgi:hypothetical protein